MPRIDNYLKSDADKSTFHLRMDAGKRERMREHRDFDWRAYLMQCIDEALDELDDQPESDND